MEPDSLTCAILANRHAALAEGLRGMLSTTFQSVFLVADSETLLDGVRRLDPGLIVLDLSFAGRDSEKMLREIREMSPSSRVLVLTVHNEIAIARLALRAGANGVVLKRCIGSDFMQAVDALLENSSYISPDIGAPELAH
jgi:DNA-binding NarL/FixJ family response regulator